MEPESHLFAEFLEAGVEYLLWEEGGHHPLHHLHELVLSLLGAEVKLSKHVTQASSNTTLTENESTITTLQTIVIYSNKGSQHTSQISHLLLVDYIPVAVLDREVDVY